MSIDSLIPGIAPGINVNVIFTIKEIAGVTGVPYSYVEKEDTLYYVNKMVKNDHGIESAVRTQVQAGETDFKFYEMYLVLKLGDVTRSFERKEFFLVRNSKSPAPARWLREPQPTGGRRREKIVKYA